MSHITPMTPRWLNVWAGLTVLATLPLLLLGAEVTSRDVGMADQVPLRTPWHILTLDLREYGLGFVIEHSHRTAGWLVGMCTIVLTVSLWLKEPRRWLRWLGTAALLTVIAQGVLGIFRVQLNVLLGRHLALVHGCFAQLVFALLMSIALFTTRRWSAVPSGEPAGDEGRRLRFWSVAVAVLLYLQIVLGSVVRHTAAPVGPRLHLLTAFAVVAAVVWLIRLALASPVREGPLTLLVMVLPVVLAAQLFLGVEAWLGKFVDPRSSVWSQIRPLMNDPSLFRSLHYLFGALLFSDAVLVALWAHRRPLEAAEPAVSAVKHLEGAL
jgi:cytochrome c oxidase assembly protein subunit 15